MMKINVDGTEFKIKFFYDTVTKKYGDRRRTTCVMEGPGFNLRGEATCNPKDQYKKVAARREALKHTIQHFDREYRAKIWDAYFGAILVDRRRGISRHWGFDESILEDYGLFDAATGGHRKNKTTPVQVGTTGDSR